MEQKHTQNLIKQWYANASEGEHKNETSTNVIKNKINWQL